MPWRCPCAYIKNLSESHSDVAEVTINRTLAWCFHILKQIGNNLKRNKISNKLIIFVSLKLFCLAYWARLIFSQDIFERLNWLIHYWTSFWTMGWRSAVLTPWVILIRESTLPHSDIFLSRLSCTSLEILNVSHQLLTFHQATKELTLGKEGDLLDPIPGLWQASKNF